MKNTKVLIATILIIVLIITISVILGINKLKNNETFFNDTFMFEGMDRNYEIEVPLYSYYSGASGSIMFRFKSIKSKEKLEREIEEILNRYEKIVDENGNTYYQKGGLKIWEYSVTNEGLFSDILIGVDCLDN